MKTFRFSNFPLFFTPRQSLGEFLKIKTHDEVTECITSLSMEDINLLTKIFYQEGDPLTFDEDILSLLKSI